MKGKRFITFCTTIICIPLISLLFNIGHFSPKLAAAESGETIQIRMNGLLPEVSGWYKDGGVAVAKMVEALVPRAKVTVFPGGQLSNYGDSYMSIVEGTADFGLCAATSTPGAFPLSTIFELPGFWPNIATTNVIINELYRKYPQFEQQFTEAKLIGEAQLLAAHLHSRKPIKSLAEMKGKVIAGTNEGVAKALAALGASSTILKVDELYTPLERGTIDGLVAPWGVVNVYKLHEVTKYHTTLNLSATTMLWFFNSRTWNKFTPEEQKRLEFLRTWVQYMDAKATAEVQWFILGKVLKPGSGQQLYELSPEDQADMKKLFRPLHEMWVQEMEKKGFPAKEMLKDAELLVKMYSEG